MYFVIHTPSLEKLVNCDDQINENQDQDKYLNDGEEDHKDNAHSVLGALDLFDNRHDSNDQQGQLEQPVGRVSEPRVKVASDRVDEEGGEDQNEEDHGTDDAAHNAQQGHTHGQQHSNSKEPHVVEQHTLESLLPHSHHKGPEVSSQAQVL